jgi:hypothetical protein
MEGRRKDGEKKDRRKLLRVIGMEGETKEERKEG